MAASIASILKYEFLAQCIDPTAAQSAVIAATHANFPEPVRRIKDASGVITSHFKEDSGYPICTCSCDEPFEQTVPQTLQAILGCYCEQQQFFFVKNAASQEKPCGVSIAMEGLGTIGGYKAVAAIADDQRVAQLPTIPCLAELWHEGPLHNGHDAVDVIGRCEHRGAL